MSDQVSNTRTVAEVMSTHLATVTSDSTVVGAARLMRDQDVGPVLVTDGDTLAGILTDRDIAIRLVAEGRNPDEVQVAELMSADPKTARPDDNVKDVMRLMGKEQVRRIPIVDESGSLVGIVAQADIVLETDDARAQRTVEKISQPGGKHAQ